MKKFSIIIPSYNESVNLKRGVLDEVDNYLRKIKINYEVIVVDDGSADNSVGLIKNFISGAKNFRLIENNHGGKANAVLTGMIKSEGDIVLFTDMDQATPIDQIEKFLPKFESGFDIVIGSRQGRKGAPVLRKLSAVAFSLLRGLILGLPFKDTQCGFKAFNRIALDKILPKVKDQWGVVHLGGGAVNAGFDVELLYLAKKFGFKIAEVPVDWTYVDTERVQVVKDAMAAIYDMFRIRWNYMTGKYGD